MTFILNFLEYIGTSVPLKDLLWAAYGIIGVLFIKKAVTVITAALTLKKAAVRTLICSAAFSAFNLFSLYMLIPDTVTRIVWGRAPLS